MSARTDVLLWAQRVIGRKGAAAHQILEIAADAGVDAAQAAFHKIARVAHPDLHRTLRPEDLELLTTAYGRAAAAYQEIRTQRRGVSASQIGPVRPSGSDPALVPADPSAPSVAEPAEPAINPAQAMSSKALIHYRKAELCLRRGDLTGALLQLKMAIARDPQSGFLRSALAQAQTEIGEKS